MPGMGRQSVTSGFLTFIMGSTRRQETTLRKLTTNRGRRARADAEAAKARRELEQLLAQGWKGGITVTAMAQAAGISRETAYQHLRRVVDVDPQHPRRGTDADQ